MVTRRVIGSWRVLRPDGTRMPGQGTVTFKPSVVIRDSNTGQIVVQDPVVAPLDQEGRIEVLLQTTDEAGLNPTGWHWDVTEEITSLTVRRYQLELPDGPDFSLSDVPVPPTAVPLRPQDQYLKRVEIGPTTVLNPNQLPTVSQTTQNSVAEFRFSLPRAANAPTLGTVDVGTPAEGPAVTGSTTASGDTQFNFRLPRSRGVTTPAATVLNPDQPPAVTTSEDSDGDLSVAFDLPRAAAFEVGTVVGGADATDAQITDVGVDGDVKLNFVLPRPTVNVGTTTPLNPDQNPAVSNSGTDAAVVLDFALPAAPTFTVGDVTTVGPSTPASTTDVGTNGNIVLDFALPRGEKGWAPVLAIVVDGARRVLQLADWTGGEGTKPASGDYIGPSGLVADIAQAVDIRGAVGPAGVAELGLIGDVTITSIVDGQALVYDDASDNWVNKSLDTDDVAEGTNLYYTDQRVEDVIAASDTDDLAEGATNLYYTDARVDTVISNSDTDDVAEGVTNLYYTDERADARAIVFAIALGG